MYVLLALLSVAPAHAKKPTVPAVPLTPAAAIPGAVSGAEVKEWDAEKNSMVLGFNGQTLTLDTSAALINGTIAKGAIVDVTYDGDKATAINVRPTP